MAQTSSNGVKKWMRWFVIIFVIELFLFIGLIATTMTDDRPPAIAGLFYWPLKYIFSFPLILINYRFPFFLEGGGTMIEVAFLSTLNDLILAGMVLGICETFKRLLKSGQTR
jgi:hypothetical protein